MKSFFMMRVASELARLLAQMIRRYLNNTPRGEIEEYLFRTVRMVVLRVGKA